MSIDDYEVIADSANELDWLEQRRGGIGASDQPGVLGLSRWASAATIYADRISDEPPDLEQNEFMRAGKRLEPFIAEWILELMNEDGRKVKGRPFGLLLRSKAYPWMLCTPDWMVDDGEGDEVPLQIKNTMRAADWDGGIPDDVMIQCLAEQIVTGVDHSYVGVLLTGNRPRWARIDRSDHEAVCQKIIDESEHLWQTIVNREPLAKYHRIDGSDPTKRALLAIHPKDDGSTVELDGLLMEQALAYDDLKRVEKEAKSASAKIANEICAAIGDHSYGVFPDGSGFSWKHQHRKETVQAASDFRVLRRTKGPKAAKQGE